MIATICWSAMSGSLEKTSIRSFIRWMGGWNKLRGVRRVVAIVWLWGCGASGPTPDQVIARHRPAAEARLDALAEAGRSLAKVPPVYEDRVDLAGPARFHDDGPALANAGLALAEDFADLARVDRDLPMRLEPLPYWEDAQALVRRGTNASGGKPSSELCE